MPARSPRWLTSWWKRKPATIKAAWIAGLLTIIAGLVGGFVQGGPAWIAMLHAPSAASPTPLGYGGSEASQNSPSVLSIDVLRDKILLAPDDEARGTIIRDLWQEVHSGRHADHHYDPAGCPEHGYGLAWNIHYDNRFFDRRVLVFSTPKDFLASASDGGGWYSQICLNPGINLSADAVGRLQAAILQRQYNDPIPWSYEVGN